MEQSLLLQLVSKLPLEPNPALVEHAKQRAERMRVGDEITLVAQSNVSVIKLSRARSVWSP